MPERRSIKQIPSDEVQGKDSWVRIKRAKYGEIRDIMRRRGELEDDQEGMLDLGNQFILDHLVAWNWVDDDGNPLPVPKTDADLDDLTDDEVNFLVEAIRGSEKKGGA